MVPGNGYNKVGEKVEQKIIKTANEKL